MNISNHPNPEGVEYSTPSGSFYISYLQPRVALRLPGATIIQSLRDWLWAGYLRGEGSEVY